MKINLNPAILYAMHNLAGKNDIRGYLNGVLFDIRPDAVILVATDGHALGAYKLPGFEVEGGLGEFPSQFIMPLDMVKKMKPGRGDTLAQIEYDPVTTIITARKLTGPDMMCKALEGRFPSYNRIMPLKLSGETAQFNPELLVKFQKFAADAGHKVVPILSYNGEDSTLVSVDNPDFVGIIMPLRMRNNEPPLKATPAWALTTGATIVASKEAKEFVEKLNDTITDAQAA